MCYKSVRRSAKGEFWIGANGVFVHLGEEHREGDVCTIPIVNPSFQRWFKWSIPVMEYQSQIRTLASFFVRLFGVDDAIRFTIGQSEGGTEGANHEEEEKSHSVQKRKSASKKKRRREEKSDSSLFESEKWTVCEIPSISGAGENLHIDLGNLRLCSFCCEGSTRDYTSAFLRKPVKCSSKGKNRIDRSFVSPKEPIRKQP